MTKSKIFIPTPSEGDLEEFRTHYRNIGLELSDSEIMTKVYGGKPLTDLYSHIEFSSTKKQLTKRRGTIRLFSAKDGLADLVLTNVSLKQFLIFGLPYIRCGTEEGCPTNGKWNGDDEWDELHQQYRLELCHSEISRWSLVFKQEKKNAPKKGILARDLKKKQVSGDVEISRIELVNNCTTSTGFEFRVVYRGERYHGSFGADTNQSDVYNNLSQHQAGTWARQTKNLAGVASKPAFGFSPIDIYNNFLGWSGLEAVEPDDTQNGSGLARNTIPINLSRYLQGASVVSGSAFTECVRTNTGKIYFDRWGKKGVEYYEKPKKRHLMLGVKQPGASESKSLPKCYHEIYSAEEVVLPNFHPSGIYNIADPVSKRCYALLPELNKCVVSKLSNDTYWLELHRSGCKDSFEFRRIVFGNLDLKNVPNYKPKSPKKSFRTLHRFGYGARNTTQTYQSNFRLPHGEKTPPHFAYLLAGKTANAVDADHYICPESFGVERAIFTWEPKNVLVIDLISFERILPVWQGRIKFPKNYLDEAFT